MKFRTWIEKHRDSIARAMHMISTAIWFAGNLVVRTFTMAGAILLYLFFTASPETTVYQLAQSAHKGIFWQAAFGLGMVYWIIPIMIYGSANRSSGSASCGVAQYATGSMSASKNDQ